MNYEDAVAWVHSLPRFAKNPGIENTKELLKKLNNPQDSLKFVHVAGTNGKGSVTMMVSSILKQAGYKVGTTISPYVINFRERFLLNCELTSKEKVAKVLTAVKNAAKEQESIVEFDAVTAAAVILFCEEKCDIVCLETGLGGRLDSTNAVNNTLVACITAIGKDHTEILGNTLSKIAFEKCGIIKNNCTVVAYPNINKDALHTIKTIAKQKECELIIPSLSDITLNCDDTLKSENALLQCNKAIYKKYNLDIPFAGIHQVYNATLACDAALALNKYGYTISKDDIENGISNVKFPARIEVLSEKPLVILDGSHNPQGAKALAQTLQNAGCKNLVCVMGVLKNKGEREILKELGPLLSCIYTVNPCEKRGLTAEELAQTAKQFCNDTIASKCVDTAVNTAYKRAKESGKGLLICGSLYLASEAREVFINSQNKK